MTSFVSFYFRREREREREHSIIKRISVLFAKVMFFVFFLIKKF